MRSQKTTSYSDGEYARQPSTPPRTPQKSNHNGPRNGPSSTVADSVSKPRSKVRTRPKDVITSPPVTNNRGTSPSNGIQPNGHPISGRTASTPSAAAFAGATFHASPAPSALPIPSFYSKSVPDSTDIKPLGTRREDSTSNSSGSATPPSIPNLASQTQREESPLDVFFKADREEKARAQSASSHQNTKSEFGPFPPPSASPHTENTRVASGSITRDRDSHFSGGTTSGLFAMELDGASSPGKPYGPSFSAPYQDRINAARSSSSPREARIQAITEPQVDRSEALKAYLFSGSRQTPSMLHHNDTTNVSQTRNNASPDQAFRHVSNPMSVPLNAGLQSRPHSKSFHFVPDAAIYGSASRTGSRSSGLRQEVTPTTTPVATPDRADGSSQSPYNTPSRMSKEKAPAIPSIPYGKNVILPQDMASSSAEPRNNDIRSMEDSLRRVLNLGPSHNTNAGSSNIGPFPSASISLTNYAGGGSAARNGI